MSASTGSARVAVDGLIASGKTSLGHEFGAAIADVVIDNTFSYRPRVLPRSLRSVP